jgi:two-component system, LytTR family, response regulator
MKALIVDDEPLARLELRRLLAEHPVFTAVAEAGDVQEALELTRTYEPAVVFLDVQLRGESGFDYLDRMGCAPPRLVLVTAFEHYAIKAFERAAIDYLLKPISSARLAATVQRLVAQHEAPSPRTGTAVVIKSGSEKTLLPWKDILRITSEGNYTRVHIRGSRTRLVLRTLKEWQTLVPPLEYVQIHRRVIVRRDCIVTVQLNDRGDRELRLEGHGSALPVGRLYWAEIKQALSLD